MSLDLAKDAHSTLKKAPSVTQSKDNNKDEFFRELQKEISEKKSQRSKKLS
jgi:hypothetical protein